MPASFVKLASLVMAAIPQNGLNQRIKVSRERKMKDRTDAFQTIIYLPRLHNGKYVGKWRLRDWGKSGACSADGESTVIKSQAS